MKNPFKQIAFWFNHDIIFWRLKYETHHRLCGYDIDRIPYKVYYIQHIWTNKVIYDYDRLECFGKLKQSDIYRLTNNRILFLKTNRR